MDQVFQQLPEVLAPDTVCHDYSRELSSNIALVRAVCKDYQAALAHQRSLESPASAMNVYQTGDYVLKEVDQRPSKLHFQFAGPYEVIQQYNNDVEVRNLIHGNILTFPVDRLKPFFGSEKDAFQSAMLDNDQYAIEAIRAYRGDPEKRMQCVFLVHFMDGDEVWLPWSFDLASTVQF
jgi:hypothetical protein